MGTCTVEVAFQGISGAVVPLSKNTHMALLSSQFYSMEKLGSIAVTQLLYRYVPCRGPHG